MLDFGDRRRENPRMIIEIGLFFLVLAAGIALVQSTVPLVGAARRDPSLMAVAPAAAVLQCVAVAGAFAVLTWAYITSDFTVLNVVRNSHTQKPLIYKISGVWGNHEGSMVLWCLILALFGAAVGLFGGNLPATLRARTLAVQGAIALAFLAFVLFTSNPFERVFPAPLDGDDLNPLLQDPGLAIHPPFLYLGYVGFSIVFSFAVAALIEGRVDAAWARWVRPWTLAAWIFLTLGIALGSWWAYYTLGWGGWWFWDPVENASFMPWLVGTALLHSAVVVEKRDGLKRWTILLAILTFSLSLLGTFLVRSGVLSSVHAFAVDPARGVFVLAILVIVIGGSLALYAWRAPALAPGGGFAPVSREGALVLNNYLLTTAAAVVLVGTLYPLVLDAFDGGKVTVGPPYFNATFVPIMVPLMLAMAVGPMLAWKRGDLLAAVQRLWAAGATTVGLFIAVLWIDGWQVGGAIGLALAGWLVLGAGAEFAERTGLFRQPPGASWRRARGLPRAAIGAMIAHAGVGILVAGATGGSLWVTESVSVMRIGDSKTVQGYHLTLRSITQERGPNYRAERANIMVRHGDDETLLTPERRMYNVSRQVLTHAAIRTTGLDDIYIALGDPDGSGGYVVRAWHHPLVPWIWFGAVVMSLGGVVSLTDRRHRVGVPVRRAVSLPAGAATP
jgi:cytochrome c-type biogenesis protein CcmF